MNVDGRRGVAGVEAKKQVLSVVLCHVRFDFIAVAKLCAVCTAVLISLSEEVIIVVRK